MASLRGVGLALLALTANAFVRAIPTFQGREEGVVIRGQGLLASSVGPDGSIITRQLPATDKDERDKTMVDEASDVVEDEDPAPVTNDQSAEEDPPTDAMNQSAEKDPPTDAMNQSAEEDVQAPEVSDSSHGDLGAEGVEVPSSDELTATPSRRGGGAEAPEASDVDEQATATLPPSAGEAAKKAEQDMHDAAEQETEALTSATESAERMADEALKSGKSIVKQAKDKLSRLYEAQRQTIKTSTMVANRSMVAAELKKEQALKHIAEERTLVQGEAQNAKRETEIVSAMLASENLAKEAVELGKGLKKTFEQMADVVNDELTKMRAKWVSTQKLANTIINESTADLDDIATQTSQVGLMVSADMRSKEDANNIVLKTTSVAEELKAEGKEVMESHLIELSEVTSLVEDLATSIAQTMQGIKSEGFLAADFLLSSSQASATKLDAAKASWSAADQKAIAAVGVVKSSSSKSNARATTETTSHQSQQRWVVVCAKLGGVAFLIGLAARFYFFWASK